MYRDHVNTPAFLQTLPDIAGKTGLGVGCGEGHNTRLLAQRGARMFAVDIAPTFVRLAADSEVQAAAGIHYAVTALGEPYTVEVSRYFDRADGHIERWLFSAASPEAKAGLKPFGIPMFHRTLSEWLNAVLAAGFVLDHFGEPHADKTTARRVPAVADTRNTAYFLQVRCHKI